METAPIPIGGSYPVGGGLSDGLTLAYNSNAWDYEQTASATTQAIPVRRSDSGLGWRLSPGELLEPTDPSNETIRPAASFEVEAQPPRRSGRRTAT